MKRIKNIIVNWVLLITAPIWVIPTIIHIFWKDKDLINVFTGKMDFMG